MTNAVVDIKPANRTRNPMVAELLYHTRRFVELTGEMSVHEYAELSKEQMKLVLKAREILERV